MLLLFSIFISSLALGQGLHCGLPTECVGNAIHVEVATSYNQCLTKCKQFPSCNWATLFTDANRCVFFADCFLVDECTDCVSGQVDCALGDPDVVFDKLLVVGGTNGAAQSSYDVIDLSGNNEQCAFDSELPFTYGSSATFMDDLAIFCGGANLGEDDNCFTLNPQDHTWSPAPIDMVRARHYSSSVMLNDSAWWIMSGMHDDSYNQNETEVCSVQDGCRLYKDMPDDYSYPLVVKVDETRVFLLRGAEAFMFNTLTETWKPLPASPAIRSNAFAGLIVNPDGSRDVVITGGTSSETDLFDVESEIWRPGPTNPHIHAGGASVQFGNSFIMVGGSFTGVYTKKIYKFDENGFTQLNQTLSRNRSYPTALLVPHDFVSCT